MGPGGSRLQDDPQRLTFFVADSLGPVLVAAGQQVVRDSYSFGFGPRVPGAGPGGGFVCQGAGPDPGAAYGGPGQTLKPYNSKTLKT